MLPRVEVDASLDTLFAGTFTTKYDRRDGHMIGGDQALCSLDMYEWNSLALATLDFRHVDPEAIRPTWGEMFMTQTSIATQLEVYSSAVRFTYRGMRVKLSTEDLKRSLAEHKIKCRAMGIEKTKLSGEYKKLRNLSQVPEPHIPFVDIDGKAALLLAFSEALNYVIRLEGPSAIIQLFAGFQELYAIGLENNELYYAQVSEFPKAITEHKLVLERHPNFAGMRIQHVSTLENTAILTNHGHVFLTGPKYAKLPCPPMVRWDIQDDVVLSVEISFHYIILITLKGHLYKLNLEDYKQHPKLLYASEEHKIKTVKYSGEWILLAITVGHQVLIWTENPNDKPTVVRLFPESPLAQLTKPTPIVLPWKVEDAAFFNKQLFVSSRRVYNYNAVFASFLNRSALTELDPFIYWDRSALSSYRDEMSDQKSNERLRDLAFGAGGAVGGSQGGYSSYQLSKLSAYGSNNYGTSLYLGDSTTSLRLRTLQQSSPKLIQDLIASSSNSPGGYLLQTPLTSTHSSATSTAISAYGEGDVDDIQYNSISDEAQGATLSGIHGPEMFAFNSRLTALYEMSDETEDERNLKNMAFVKLNDEFMARSMVVVKTIVEEMHLPDEQKTFATLRSAGGLAGGEKYLIDGNIFVKLCIDNNSLYGGNEWSGKVANLEIHGMDAYASCLPHLPKGSKLRVPLMSMIDYLGYRALVSTMCPINKLTIVYGSNDAGQTVHNDDEEAEELMFQCAQMLNLAPHVVKNCSTLISSAADVEVHRGQDGFLYLLDTARVFPPVQPGVVKSVPLGAYTVDDQIHAKDLSREQTQSLLKGLDSVPISEGLLYFKLPKEPEPFPSVDPSLILDPDEPLPEGAPDVARQRSTNNASVSNLPEIEANFVNPTATALLGRIIRGDAWFLRNSIGQSLYHQFRPEYVKAYPTPLSSDAFSAFADDPEGKHNKDVKEASSLMEQHYLVSVKSQFCEATPFLLPSLDTCVKQNALGTHTGHLMSAIYSPQTLVKFLHRVGLNIRSLGNIRVHAPLSHIRNLAMIEMVSRACVSYVKRRIRSAQALHTACRQSMGQATHDSSNSQLDDWDFLPSVDVSSFSDKPLEYFLKAILVQAFNSIFAHSASSDFFWTQVLKIHLLVKFGADCLLEAETYRKYSLQLETPMSYLFQIISHRCGVIWDHETATKMQSASWSTTPISLSADQIVGFALSSKSIKMASIQHLKQKIYDGIFKDTITEQQKYGLPAFHPPSYSDPSSSEVRNLVYHPVYNSSYENPKKAKDPLMQPATDNASQKSADFFPQDSSSTIPLAGKDGLDQFHNKSIEFYSKWTDMLEKAGKPVSIADRVKFMISRVRPILDNRCPGGAVELDVVESEWRTMCNLLKEVPMVNCEVLAQIFYIRGQILHLRNDYFGAEQYYMCALNTLAMPMYNSHIVGIQTMHMIYGGKIRPEDAYVKANRRCSMHPFAMLIIDKILTLQVEINGSIMSQFYAWTLFRYIWSTWPCLGSMVAKRRIFNGHSIPLAMVHPHRWRYVRSFNSAIGKFDSKIEEQAFHSFLSQGIYELDHPIVQKWLADVYDLESNIGFDVSTHWLDSDLRTFPRLLIPLMAASTFAPITHQPVFQPTGPLNAFMTSALAHLLPANFAWMWWSVMPPYPQHTNFTMTTKLGRYEATICYNPKRRIGQRNEIDKSPSRITDCDALLFNRYLIHETGASTDPHKQLQSMRQQLAAVSKQLDEPFEPYKHYPPETLERFMHGSVLILRVPLFHNATDVRNNEGPDFYILDRTESTVSTIQYWNPKFPMPRHFMVHMSISPEGYHVIGMPDWFDNVGAIQLDRYVCQRKTEHSAEFTVITEKGTLILAKDLKGVGGSDGYPRMTTEEDYNQVKLLDFAGESPLWLRFNRSPPLQYFANADEQEMRQMKTLSVCVTRSGHIYIWGSNEHGLFGNGRDNEWSDSPKLVSSLMSNKIIDVDVGVGSIITLSDDGVIHFWGSILPAESTHFITQYQLETEKRIHQPTFLPCLKELPMWGGVVEQKCSAISAGCHFVVAVSNYGIPYFYGLQSQYTPLSPDWKRVYCPERITAVSSGTWHTILLGESGCVYGFGLNENGQCGFPIPSEIDGFTRCLAPIPLEAYMMKSSKPVKVVQIQASFSRSIALDSDGQVWIWGTARQSVPHRIRLPSPAAWLSFSSQGHFMVLTEFPQIPSRTLPLVSPEEQLDAIRRIVEEVRLSAQPAPKSAVTRAFGKSQYDFTFTLKASIPLSPAAISDDTQASSSTESESPITPQVADPVDSILPPTETPVTQREPEPQSVPNDSIGAVNSVASSSFLTNRSQVLNKTRVASSITPRLPLSREEQVMIDLWGDSGSLVFNTITKMIDMAFEPLKEKMESLDDRIKALERKPDSKSR